MNRRTCSVQKCHWGHHVGFKEKIELLYSICLRRSRLVALSPSMIAPSIPAVEGKSGAGPSFKLEGGGGGEVSFETLKNS